MMLFACFSSAYYLLSGIVDVLSLIPLCAESWRGAAVALVLRSKQKLLPVCYSHTQRKLYYPEKVKRHRKKKTIFNPLKTRAKSCSDQPEIFRTASVSEKTDNLFLHFVFIFAHREPVTIFFDTFFKIPRQNKTYFRIMHYRKFGA
jgi:hypothetical protein